MISSIQFLLRLAIYFYLIVTWLKLLCDAIGQNDQIRYEENVIKRVGNQINCQQICQDKYSIISGNINIQSWVTYINSQEAKDTANKQIDEIADYYKNVSLEYAKSKNKVGDDYKISFVDVGCFFKRYDNYFQCFDTQLDKSKLRITRSYLNITLWEKVSHLIKDTALTYLPKGYILQLLSILNSILPSETSVLSIFGFIAFVLFISQSKFFSSPPTNKDENNKKWNYDGDIDRIQYGFRVMDYCKYIQDKQIFSRIDFRINSRIKSALERPQNKKIKLISQSAQGIGITSNIQAWCQQTSISQGKQVIHYNLKTNIVDQKLCSQNHFYNIQSIFYAIINRENRNFKNMIITQLQNFTSYCTSVFTMLFQVSFLFLFLLVGVAATTEGWCFVILTTIIIIFTYFKQLYAFVWSFYSKIIYQFKNTLNKIKSLLDKNKYAYMNKKIIVIDQIDEVTKIDNYQKPLFDLLKLIQIVQEGKDYDVILISKSRLFSEYLIERANILREEQLIMADFEHRIIYPLSFGQVQGILYDRTINKRLNKARLFGLFSNNTNKFMKSLKNCKIDQKYNKEQEQSNQTIIKNNIIKEINNIIISARKQLEDAQDLKEIQKYLRAEDSKKQRIQQKLKYLTDNEDENKKICKEISEEVKTIFKENKKNEQEKEKLKIKGKLKKQNEPEQEKQKSEQRQKQPLKQKQLRDQINRVYNSSGCNLGLNQELQLIYNWYRYLEKRRTSRQSKLSLKQWLADTQFTKPFKSDKQNPVFEIAISYLNHKRILHNGTFTCISYQFKQHFQIKERGEDNLNVQNQVKKSQPNYFIFVKIAVLGLILSFVLFRGVFQRIWPAKGQL